MAENSANMSKRKAATILIVWGMVVFWLVAWDRVLYSRKAEILVIESGLKCLHSSVGGDNSECQVSHFA